MANDKLELNGVITKVLKGTKFIVKLENDAEVLAQPSGRLRMYKIKLLQDDHVTVAISPYDLTKGIIVWRSKEG